MVMIATLFRYDVLITNAINALIPHARTFDLFFSFFSMRASSLPIWIFIALLLIIFEEKVDKRFVFYLVLSILVTGAFVFVLKNTTRRPRPIITYASLQKVVDGKKIKTCDTDFSFPSGHSSLAFAAAGIIAAFDKKRKYGYYLIAALIGLSRIYLQCHFFLDVLSGAILGFAVSKIIVYYRKPLSRYISTFI